MLFGNDESVFLSCVIVFVSTMSYHTRLSNTATDPMRKAKIKRIERIEHYLVRIIQQPGADQGHPWPIRLLLAVLRGVSLVFRNVVLARLFLYEVGICRRYPLGCQVISVGNITAGGTGKTPVVEIFARELQKSGRKVAVVSATVPRENRAAARGERRQAVVAGQRDGR